MSITSFDQLEKQILQNKKIYKAAFVAPSDLTTLYAVLKASSKNLIEPIFIGDEDLIHKKAAKNKLDITDIEILDFVEPYKAVETAGKLACEGEIDLIIKGSYHHVNFIEKLFYENREFCDLQKVHHIALCKTKEYNKFLFLTDGFVHCQPDINIKSNIIDSAVNFVHRFGIPIPKVALLAAVEVVYKQMPVTVEADELTKMYADCAKQYFVEGPLSFDIAIDKHAAEIKGLTDSEVAGDADILVAPNIETAGGVYKALSLFSDSEIGGVILGGKVPVVCPIEIDSEQTRYNSILLSLIAC